MVEPCDGFQRNANGSWTSLKPFNISGPSGGQISAGAGVTFTPGTLFNGVDLAAWLEKNCQ